MQHFNIIDRVGVTVKYFNEMEEEGFFHLFAVQGAMVKVQVFYFVLFYLFTLMQFSCTGSRPTSRRPPSQSRLLLLPHSLLPWLW